MLHETHLVTFPPIDSCTMIYTQNNTGTQDLLMENKYFLQTVGKTQYQNVMIIQYLFYVLSSQT